MHTIRPRSGPNSVRVHFQSLSLEVQRCTLSVRSAVLAGLGCALLARRRSGRCWSSAKRSWLTRVHFQCQRLGGAAVRKALQLFDKMQQQGLEPNVITYIAVSSAC